MRQMSGEVMEFPNEEKFKDYNGQNRSFTFQNNRQKDVKDELNVDRMKYAAYLDEEKDHRSQKKLVKINSTNQLAAIEEHLGINQDGAKSVDLPRKSRQTLDYLQLTKQQQEQQKKVKKHKKAEDDSEESSDEEAEQNFEIMFPEPNEGEIVNQMINNQEKFEENKEQEGNKR